MANTRFEHFGTLYRAAFAERDPERKLALLSTVQKAIQCRVGDLPQRTQWLTEECAGYAELSEKPSFNL